MSDASAAGAPDATPIVARGGESTISVAGRSLVIHEWSGSGPTFMHVHNSDDEAWHVLEGMLRFTFLHGQVEASKGTTVFVPAGVPHSYTTVEPSRYLMFLTPRLDQLIARLHQPWEEAQLPAILAEFDTDLVAHNAD